MFDFDRAQQQYLHEMDRGLLATIAPDGTPQNKPVGFHHAPGRSTIDIWGYELERSAKFRNVAANPPVAFTVEDVPDPAAGAEGVRFMEIRGRAEQVVLDREPGPGLSPWAIRIHPRRVLSYNIGEPGLRRRDAIDDVSARTAGSGVPRPAVGLTGEIARRGRDAVDRQVAELQAGLDAGDADRYNRHFADDLMWGSPYGATVDGYPALHEIHAAMFGHSDHRHSRYEVTRVVTVAHDVVLAQVRRDALGDDGEPIASRGDEPRFSEMALYVLVRRGGRWWMAAGQNTKIDLDRGAAR